MEGISPTFQQVGVQTGQPSLDFGSRPMSEYIPLGLDSAVRFRFPGRPSFQVWDVAVTLFDTVLKTWI